MADDPDFIFVYGTLRPSAGGDASRLVKHLEPAGRATARGTLYDLGSYPGMAEGSDVVHGELLRISSPGDLETLDSYEECDGPTPLFRRVRTEARREDGSVVAAWIYLYSRGVSGGTRIASGDYLRRDQPV